MFTLYLVAALALAPKTTVAVNFPFEEIQLHDSDIRNNPDIAFGKLPVTGNRARCKTFPGDADWPSTGRWNAFNTSLGGSLIKGIPPAAACYNGTYFDERKCAEARRGLSNSLWTGNDPVVPNNPWQLGNACPLPATGYSCNVTAYPAYVVNATTAKHVQSAVNFARNNNIRVTIKNTGHDFLGRGTGGGALQIWTHHLKGFEYLPNASIGKYQGKAARFGSALQQWEVHDLMEKHNITILAPGSSTVGNLGGWMQGGGFSILTSKFGLMADQVLSLEVVTADGRFVHADPEENEDLYWALRGGGPSNFGVVTSAVIKVHDTVPISVVQFYLQTNAVSGNRTDTVQVNDTELFWKGVKIYFSHLPRVTDAQGIGWNYIYKLRVPGSSQPHYQLTAQYTLPGFQQADAKRFLAPVFRQLNDAGIHLAEQDPKFYASYPKQAYNPNGPGGGAGGGRFGSRLIPRENLEDPASEAFNKTMAAIRTLVQDGGYPFHSVDFTPTHNIAGYPGANSAVNPALRNAIMHITSFDTASYGPETPPAQQIANHARLNTYIQVLRDVSPGSGAYMNEADTEEPDFQQGFFGANYERLLAIKRSRDPWQVFYAVTAVGSEEWVVEGTDGLPTQQGRLCRVRA